MSTLIFKQIFLLIKNYLGLIAIKFLEYYDSVKNVGILAKQIVSNMLLLQNSTAANTFSVCLEMLPLFRAVVKLIV